MYDKLGFIDNKCIINKQKVLTFSFFFVFFFIPLFEVLNSDNNLFLGKFFKKKKKKKKKK